MHITSVRYLRRDSYWDFSVEEYENYWLAGGWHHNTTECALAKAALFMQRLQPPPRPDTPFWIIGTDLEQIIETGWKEKLWGHRHIKSVEVNWSRVRWHDPKANLPLRVPLKPWPRLPDNNWMIEFKSYEQGRKAMQARALGGFLFSEQFPWPILTEVLRGCREYNFPGSKLAEFTPVDPALSIELETLIEEDRLPDGWAVYRANTECAMEAGHVSESWFHEFFGMIPDEMRETRLTGQFAVYEGAIYQGFNPLVHLVAEERVTPDGNFPLGVYHRRAIDWGSGPENAFCCLWAYKNGMGQWTVYDEYYSTNQLFTVHDHLKAIADQWPWPEHNPYYGMTYADPSEPGYIRIASRLSEFDGKYTDIPIQNANNRVYEGIDYVRSMLKPTVLDEHGRTQPRLFISRAHCPNLSRQMRTYRWERSSGKGVNPRDAKPQPLKKDDHAADALRYLLFSEADKTGHTPEAIRREREPRRHGVLIAGRSR